MPRPGVEIHIEEAGPRSDGGGLSASQVQKLIAEALQTLRDEMEQGIQFVADNIDARIDKLERNLSPEPWKPLAPLYNASIVADQGGYQEGRYRRWGDVVEVEGIINVSGTGTLFTLPPGYRPKAAHYFITGGNVVKNIELFSDGRAVTGQVGAYWSLHTLRFSTL